MPPRSKRPRRSGPSASTVNSIATSTASTSSSLSNNTSNQQDGTMQVHVTALSSALSLAVQKAVQDALRPPPSVTTSTNAASTTTVVSAHVPTTASIVQDSVVQATQAIAGTSGGNIVSPNVQNMPTTPLFSSVAIPLGSAKFGLTNLYTLEHCSKPRFNKSVLLLGFWLQAMAISRILH